MKKQVLLLFLGVSTGIANVAYAGRPVLKCSPGSGVATVTLRTARDLPIKFSDIGSNKTGEIIWLSRLDKQVTVLKKITANGAGGSVKQLRGYIGKDVGRFFVRYRDQSKVVIDSGLFASRSPNAVTADGDLRVCGYSPAGISSVPAPSCTAMPQASTYTDLCIGGSDPTCRPAQLKVWMAALSAWSANCGKSTSSSGTTGTPASCGAMPSVRSYTSQCTGYDPSCSLTQKSKYNADYAAWEACTTAGTTLNNAYIDQKAVQAVMGGGGGVWWDGVEAASSD